MAPESHSRLFVALIETYQQADGSIPVPEPLWDYARVKVLIGLEAQRPARLPF